jgi:hypothetical protein
VSALKLHRTLRRASGQKELIGIRGKHLSFTKCEDRQETTIKENGDTRKNEKEEK